MKMKVTLIFKNYSSKRGIFVDMSLQELSIKGLKYKTFCLLDINIVHVSFGYQILTVTTVVSFTVKGRN